MVVAAAVNSGLVAEVAVVHPSSALAAEDLVPAAAEAEDAPRLHDSALAAEDLAWAAAEAEDAPRLHGSALKVAEEVQHRRWAVAVNANRFPMAAEAVAPPGSAAEAVLQNLAAEAVAPPGSAAEAVLQNLAVAEAVLQNLAAEAVVNAIHRSMVEVAEDHQCWAEAEEAVGERLLDSAAVGEHQELEDRRVAAGAVVPRGCHLKTAEVGGGPERRQSH
jgi:hypothetical protein